MARCKIDLADGQTRFSADNFRDIHAFWEKEHERIVKLQKYFDGRNSELLKRAKRFDGAPDNRKPFAYGQLLPRTTIGYMLKRDPEISIKDDELLQEMLNKLIQSIGYPILKKAPSDVIIFGVGYNLVYQTSDENSPVTFKVAPLDPAECVAVWNHDITPKLVALVRYYTVKDIEKVDVWYADAFVQYSRSGQEIGSIPHSAKRVPVIVYQSEDTPKGVAEPVLGLIDALDITSNEDLNELQKFAMALRVAYGIHIDEATMKRADNGDILEIPNAVDGAARLEYLTREINDTFHGSMREFLISQIHKLSGVPDFADPSFAAISGIALEYKLMGFENLCGTLELGMIEGTRETLQLLLMLNGATVKQDMWVNFSRNLPRDDQYKMTVAESMKRVGLSSTPILTYLSDYIDNPEDEIARQNKEKSTLFGNMNESTNSEE